MSSRSRPGPSRPGPLAVLLLVALVLSACHATPHPATPIAPARPGLQHDLDAILDAPPLRRSYWGVDVRSLGSGATLYARNAGRLLMPASNLKVVTLAAAADRLGWNYTYDTRLMAAGPIRDGVLHGDLLVIGSGDPQIGGGDAPTRVFDGWADVLRARGIRRVEGRIVGDDNAWDDASPGAGWSWDDLTAGYAAGAGALQFHESRVLVTVTPGPAAGASAAVAVEPAGGLTVSNGLTTSAAGSLPVVEARRAPDGAALILRGSVPAGSAPIVRSLSVGNPTRFFVTMLRRTLIADGVDVRGPAVDIDDIGDAPARGDATLVADYRSPPLSELAVRLMKASQNLYAETLLKTIGAEAGTPTAETGRRLALETVERWGVSPGALVMVDGSGLSRYNYVAPEALVTILTHVDTDQQSRGPFEAALPLGGEDGTLAGRFAAPIAAGNVRAKTGSMSNVRALSGYVTAASGERLVFSILANNFDVPGGEILQAIDAIVMRLAGER